MVERKCITLLYSYNENWMGGTYYIINIIKALNHLEDKDKPFLIVIYDLNSSMNQIEEIHYPYIKIQSFSFTLNYFQRIINKIFFYLNGEIIFKQILPSAVTNNIYPLTRYTSTKNIKKGYHWIPDFQEKYMPQLFSKYEVRLRDKSHKALIRNNTGIVFSSETALNDFNLFYPENKNEKYVLRFVSIIDRAFENIQISQLLSKYNITKPYFIIPNQFWKHKNHEIVIKAVKELSGKGLPFQLVLTGKEHDYRYPEYSTGLRQYVKDNGLENLVVFLGFIPRDEQLQLMNYSLAIIQPSLFEGWSTVVEDAKVLNHFILVSDIPIHREQIGTNCSFFYPDDYVGLGLLMENILGNSYQVSIKGNSEDVIDFAKKIISLF